MVVSLFNFWVGEVEIGIFGVYWLVWLVNRWFLVLGYEFVLRNKVKSKWSYLLWVFGFYICMFVYVYLERYIKGIREEKKIRKCFKIYRNIVRRCKIIEL